MPLFLVRSVSSIGSGCLVSTLWPASAPHGESRSISLPFLPKCVMKGPYSSEIQNEPSGRATRPSESYPLSGLRVTAGLAPGTV
jgi:hypothetical protein